MQQNKRPVAGMENQDPSRPGGEAPVEQHFLPSSSQSYTQQIPNAPTASEHVTSWQPTDQAAPHRIHAKQPADVQLELPASHPHLRQQPNAVPPTCNGQQLSYKSAKPTLSDVHNTTATMTSGGQISGQLPRTAAAMPAEPHAHASHRHLGHSDRMHSIARNTQQGSMQACDDRDHVWEITAQPQTDLPRGQPLSIAATVTSDTGGVDAMSPPTPCQVCMARHDLAFNLPVISFAFSYHQCIVLFTVFWQRQRF